MTTKTATPTTKAFVLLSGGLDSTTCVYLAAKDFGKENVTAISIHYGQRHSREIIAAGNICDRIGISHRTAKLAEQAPSMLTDVGSAVPDISYGEIEGVSPMYVPYRNGQMLSHIAMIASYSVQGEGEKAAIYFGAHAEDAANWAYPDCTPEFIGAQANAIHVGTYFKVRLYTPLMWLMKSQIVALGAQLGVPFADTWSCYRGGVVHCGTCATCISRREAFTIASVLDPTTYAA